MGLRCGRINYNINFAQMSVSRYFLFLLASTVISPSVAFSNSATELKLANLKKSIDQCMYYSSRDSFPHYFRPEAKDICDKTITDLHAFRLEANKNKNLDCSSRVSYLVFDMWKTQFLGSTRTSSDVDAHFNALSKNCYNAFSL